MTARLNIWHLLFVFALAALPFAATFSLPYPDERHYTDGAMGMLRDHDWLVPKTPEGQPRLNKPPLAYWATAGGFIAAGVNPLGARLPFLLAACATVFFTWRLARRLTGSDKTALLAALILLTHGQFLLAAIRSIPDAWLCLFILMSAEGFLRLIVYEETAAAAYWLAYGGAALAAMDKGLLGLGIVLFAWIFAWAGKRDFGAVKKLLHWPSILVGVVFVAGWFILAFKLCGGSPLRVLYADQVTDNVRGHWWSPLWRLPVYAAILAVNFLPWSLPALEAWGRGKWRPATGPMNPRARHFLLAWCLALVGVFAFGENISVRYLLPAAPLGAILVAEILAEADGMNLFFSTRRILLFLIGLDLFLCAVALGINAQWDMSAGVFLAVNLFAVVVIGLGFGALKRKWLTAAEGAGLALLLVFPLLFLAVNRVLLPDPCEQMADLIAHQGPPGKPVLFVGRPAMASGVRLFLAGKYNVVRADNFEQVKDHVADYSMVLAPQNYVVYFQWKGLHVHGVTIIPAAPPLSEWWPALKSRRLPEALQQHGKKYFLLTPES